MSIQSERIRAVLARSDAHRSNGEGGPPAIAVNTDNLEALLRSETKPSQPVMVESEPESESAVDVEEFLPLIAASDETRATLPLVSTPVPAPMPSFATASVKKSQGFPTILLVSAGLAALAVVAGVVIFVMKDRSAPAPEPVAAAPAPQGNNFPLQVQAEPQGNGLIDIRWNPQSAPVSQAREGRLVIAEKDQEPRVVELTPAQLKIGHLSYQSQAERLEFRLEVVDTAGATARESVLALSSKTTPASPAQPLPAAAIAPDPLEPARSAPRPFSPPAQKSIPETRALVLDPPAPVSMGSTAAPGGDVRQTTINLPSLPAKPAPAPQPVVTPPVRMGGQIQPPMLVKKVSPAYPQFARVGRIQGDVQFIATIGKDGKVQSLQLMSGPPALVEAARDAVKQWVYRPSLLNGDPVVVTTQIDVNFTLGN